jgi:D-alanyl-D-alanine carboxypeptidase
LNELGLIGLDDDIALLLEDLASPGDPIALRNLLNHTSGLPGPHQVIAKFMDRRHLTFSRSELLELLEGEPRDSKPGQEYSYNNLGYVLLGLVIEEVSGLTFEQFLQDEISLPEAPDAFLLCDSRRIIQGRASGYAFNDGKPFNHEPVNVSLVFTAGGLCANATELATWFRALANGRVIDSESFETMSTPSRLKDNSLVHYGYGIFMDEAHGLRRVFQGGDVNGFSAHVAHYIDLDITVAVLTNTRSPAARFVEQKIAKVIAARSSR